MALDALDLGVLLRMDAEARENYFLKYARYLPDAQILRYAIRVGSQTLFDRDTMELRLKFEARVKKLRRKYKVRVSKRRATR